ncbi:hypothetical protein FOMPIDRAFT_1121512 [Fomitopsis schrenkii]|uniref:Cytochrome P450 n=1 Tax=Fomitopsis schrenkii TaxID=2126942 RepID=S8E7K1_FOMSC|nr:hypothetical protein FOMPIDRAFT_1121512 [Fomitopsis schrenkii]
MPTSLPPGPRPLPVVGNALQLPHDFLHRTLGQWAQSFGDLIFLRVFRQPTLVINSLQAAKELLEVKGAKYSDRSPFHLMRIIGFDVAVPFLPYGEQWRRSRKWIQASFVDQAALVRWQPMQREVTTELLSRLAQTPEDFVVHIRHCISTLLLDSTYGRIRGDAVLQASEAILQGFVESGSPAAALVDHFPCLQYIPSWMPFSVLKADIWALRPTMRRLTDELFQKAKAMMEEENESDSFIASLLQQRSSISSLGSDQMEEEEEIKSVAITLYLGMRKTEIVLKTFILAMTIHQDVYAKAQETIDEVVGNTRLPELSDRQSLPYVDAILKEVYRINVPLPISLPRRLNEDDQFRDFHIPKGTWAISNLWQVHAILLVEQMGNDANYYSDADAFRPERFIDPATGLSTGLDPKDYIFSFGRRACPGQRFADDSLWLVIASIIATFDIKRTVDDNGREVTPPMAFSPGLTSHPREFTCLMRPRSQHALDLIMDLGSSGSALRTAAECG